jgi:hypothetical protein
VLIETGISTAYVIGSLATTAEQAMELAPIALMPQFFFIGLFISTSQLCVGKRSFPPVESLELTQTDLARCSPYWLQWPQCACRPARSMRRF